MNNPIDYFFQTSPTIWDLIEVISLYDQEKQYDSLGSLLEEIEHDVGVVVGRQPAFQRYEESIIKHIQLLKDLDCLKNSQETMDRPTDPLV